MTGDFWPTFNDLINGPFQTVVSFVALAGWTFLALRSTGWYRTIATIIAVFCAVFAIQSLTYVDAIGGDTARGFTFVVRSSLAIAAVIGIGLIVFRAFQRFERSR